MHAYHPCLFDLTFHVPLGELCIFETLPLGAWACDMGSWILTGFSYKLPFAVWNLPKL